MVHALMHNARWNHTRVEELQQAKPFDFRNPPLFWRCVFVGIALAMAGTIAGLVGALTIQASFAPYSILTGAVVGFLAGFFLERY